MSSKAFNFNQKDKRPSKPRVSPEVLTARTNADVLESLGLNRIPTNFQLDSHDPNWSQCSSDQETDNRVRRSPAKRSPDCFGEASTISVREAQDEHRRQSDARVARMRTCLIEVLGGGTSGELGETGAIGASTAIGLAASSAGVSSKTEMQLAVLGLLDDGVIIRGTTDGPGGWSGRRATLAINPLGSAKNKNSPLGGENGDL